MQNVMEGNEKFLDFDHFQYTKGLGALEMHKYIKGLWTVIMVNHKTEAYFPQTWDHFIKRNTCLYNKLILQHETGKQIDISEN